MIGRAFLRYWPISTFGVLETPTYPDLRRPRPDAGPADRTVTPVIILLAVVVVAAAVIAPSPASRGSRRWG